MTPEQLRERSTEVLKPGWLRLSDTEAKELLRAHAAALEELARLNAAWKAQQFHLEHEEKESEFQAQRAERAEAALAEAERKCERLKFHAERMAGLLWYGPSDFAAEKKALDAYRAEFKEDAK